MSEQPGRRLSCVCCWDQKKPCLQDPLTLICRRCRNQDTWGHSVIAAPTFYDAVFHEALYKHAPKNSLSSLGVEFGGFDYNQFFIRITPSTSGTQSSLMMHIDGPFDTRNTTLMAQLDGLVVNTLIAQLRDKANNSHEIYFAVVTGGYIHLLSSMFFEQEGESVTTTVNGTDCQNDYARHNLQSHFRFLVFSRLREYMNTCLSVIREGCRDNEPDKSATAAHAAAALLRYEIGYFMTSLKHGNLSMLDHLSSQVKNILIEWFTAIEIELSQRLLDGCGHYPTWHKAIKGNNNLIRRVHETISVTLALHVNKFTFYEEPPPTPTYTYLGNGDVFFTSPQQYPALKVPAMSYDIPDGLEQLPHASEASVVAVSDPFPDFQSLLRRVDEEYPLFD